MNKDYIKDFEELKKLLKQYNITSYNLEVREHFTNINTYINGKYWSFSVKDEIAALNKLLKIAQMDQLKNA